MASSGSRGVEAFANQHRHHRRQCRLCLGQGWDRLPRSLGHGEDLSNQLLPKKLRGVGERAAPQWGRGDQCELGGRLERQRGRVERPLWALGW